MDNEEGKVLETYEDFQEALNTEYEKEVKQDNESQVEEEE